MSVGRRIGTFCLALGILLVVFYAYSASGGVPTASLLLYGMALIGVGILLVITHPLPPPPDSGRFRVLRRKPPSERRRK